MAEAAARDVEVLVVGAGPVGLLAGLQLARHGLRVEVIDEAWRSAVEHSYATALHPQSLTLLDGIGISDQIRALGHRVDRIAIYDDIGRREVLELDNLPTTNPYVLVVPQCILEQALERALTEAGGKVSWNRRATRLENDVAWMRVDIEHLRIPTDRGAPPDESKPRWTRQIEAEFVLGADGFRSGIRAAAGIAVEHARPAVGYGIFEFTADEAPGNEASLVLTKNTINALWPLPGDRWRWTFQLDDTDVLALEDRRKNRMRHAPGFADVPDAEERLRQLIAARAPWFEPRPRYLHWSTALAFEGRLAESFGKDRVWLAGDAAHVTGPAGIQSMNAGLVEAFELSNRIADAIAGRGTMDDIAAYGAERTAEWRRMLGLTGAVEPIENVTDDWFASQRDRLLPCLPATGDDLVRLLGLLGLRWT